MRPPAILEVSGLQAGYGDIPVLSDVSLSVGASEVVAVLGRNGMGKTTSIRAIMGLLPASGGHIAIDGEDVRGPKPFRIARRGVGLVPEGRQIFPNLTAEENLLATSRPGPWTLRSVFLLFPRLHERRHQLGHSLSGGEQQMLAIGRALMTNPRLLILDEATEGMAPIIRREIWACLARLKQQGMAILLIDKTLDALMKLADWHVIIEKGATVWAGTSGELAAAPAVRERYLHI